MKFGDNLRELRKNYNLSQEELAEKVKVSRQSISKWETGDAYPEMNNILELCHIFKCNINSLVNDQLVDIDSLDEDVKMSVVKFNEEKQKKTKILSKVIYVIARICKIFMYVGIVGILIGFVAINVVGLSTKIEDNTLTIFDRNIVVNEDEIIFNSSKDDDKTILKVTDEGYLDFMKVYDYLKTHDAKKTLAIFDLMLITAFASVVVMIFLFKHIEKLFYNINTGDTPFTLENVNHIKKIAYCSIVTIVLPGFINGFADIIGIGSNSFKLDGINLLTILILFCLSYVFEYGYEIQLDSKGKIYDEK